MRYRKLLLMLALFASLAGCWPGARWSSGDRVLVAKNAYDTGLQKPERFQTVVFKYPRGPIDKHTPKNYIKRLWGLPGEILAILFGRVYCWSPQPGQAPPFDDKDASPNQLWQAQFRHDNDEISKKLFNEGAFKILRKPPDVQLALSRIVYDNDYQAKDLVGKIAPRWNPLPGSEWKADQPHTFSHRGGGAEIDWLRYQHLLRPSGVLVGDMKVRPSLITDVMGYNSYRLAEDFADRDRTPAEHWVGDLMLDIQLDVVEPKGLFVMELSKGINRFQAHWDLATGKCTLYQLRDGAPPKELGSATTRVKSPGSYRVRFANVDARLTVWVKRDLPFGAGIEYPPPEAPGPEDKGLPPDKLQKILEERRGPRANDLEPASLGSKGANVKVSHLRLWRDTYYTASVHSGGCDYDGPRLTAAEWTDPSAWKPIQKARSTEMYVQPGHYLVLGDNSPNSSDSRDWGTVPERLLLGRALVVYYPFHRAGAIR